MPTHKKNKSFHKKAPSILSLSNITKAAAAVAFVVLLLTMLPAAIPDTEVETTRPVLSFDSNLPEIDATADPIVFPHFIVVYPEREEWGKEEADYITTVLSGKFHAHFVTMSDKDYAALDSGMLALYNTAPSLTITIGITDLIGESYLRTLARLGADGLEIIRNENRIDIVSASWERINEGANKLISSISFSGSYSIGEELFISDPRPMPETDFTPDLVTDSEVNLLTFSHIDNNDYTLRALEGIIDHQKPDIIIFNGNIDGGCKTRQELATLWSKISAILKKNNVPWCFTPGNLSGDLPRIVVCEVISSFDGCIRQFKGDSSVTYSLTVANTSDEISATIYVGDVYDTSEALCELIEADAKLYARASNLERTVIGIFPAIPEALSSLGDVSAFYTSDKLTDLYDSFIAAGGNTLICAADPAHPIVIQHEGGTLALCGSIGFSSRGLGGRFDYNNSIRGGMLLTLTPHRAGYTTAKFTYLLAADLGLTER